MKQVFVYALVAAIVMLLAFSMLKVSCTVADIAIAAVGHAPFVLVPTIGDPLSLLVLIILLRWRVSNASMFDLGVVVSASRLLVIPVLLAWR